MRRAAHRFKRATIALQGVYPTAGWEQTKVDENGDYLLKHLAPGMYNVFLKKGPEGWTAVAQDLIKVVEGQTSST